MEPVRLNKDNILSGNNAYTGVSTLGKNAIIVSNVAQLEAAVDASDFPGNITATIL